MRRLPVRRRGAGGGEWGLGNGHDGPRPVNGSVVGWGKYNTQLPATNVPPSATNVVALAHGDEVAFAIRSNRTVVGWGHDPSLSTADRRVAAQSEIDDRLAEWSSRHTKEGAAELLQAHGVSAMPVMGPLDHVADAHLLERDAIVTVHHAVIGDERHVANPLRFSRLPQRTAAAAPLMGEHTEAVLTSVLGLGADEVAALVAEGVCR